MVRGTGMKNLGRPRSHSSCNKSVIFSCKGDEDLGDEIWCSCMASSKASKCFQHLEMGCPSLPQKLQVSLDFFLVLEVDSVDFEESLPLGGLVGGLGSIFGVSFFDFSFCFDFLLEFWATNAWLEEPEASTCWIFSYSHVNRWQNISNEGIWCLSAKASIGE